MTSLAPVSTLDGWVVSSFTGGGRTHDVYEKGSGPGVVLIPEIPGMTPEVLGLAQHLVDNGSPSLCRPRLGRPGEKPAWDTYSAP